MTIKAISGSMFRSFVRQLSFVVLILCSVTLTAGAEQNNRLESVAIEQGTDVPTVLITSQEPVGYRYTVYDSTEPIRVVVDFPGMELANIPEVTPVSIGAVQEIRVSRFDLSSGKLARVEVVLGENVEYQVSLDEKDFRITFPSITATGTAEASQPASEPVAAPSVAAETVSSPAAATTAEATVLRDVSVSPGQAVISANGPIGLYKYFTLKTPPRLVLDVYGVRPAFKARTFASEAGIKQVRVGAYKEKTRLVFDAEGADVPEHVVNKQDNELLVSWGASASAVPAAEPASSVDVAAPVESASEPVEVAAPEVMPHAGPGKPAAIETLEFNNDEGRSEVVLTLSADTEVSQPVQDGNLVRFEVKNSTLPRALRRTVDASAFPSAVTSITPYTVKEGATQNVRIAVELKGMVPYSLEDNGTVVKLLIDDGAFAEPAPPAKSTVEIPVDMRPAEGDLLMPSAMADAQMMGMSDDQAYDGQKISLVFDSADIRSILQLIGDVSGLNILASDDVKGTITLRLIDVPWDQALDLVLDTADLAKVQEGNVLRVMPMDKKREMDKAQREAKVADVDEGVLETRIFQVSYTSVGDMKAILEDIKTERGSIISDARNKQLIVKEVESVLEQMQEMILQVDKPEKQVMIEARIVEANANFSRDLGVKWLWDYQNDSSANGVGSNGLDSAQLGLGGSFFIPPDVINVAGVGTSFNFGTLGIDSLTLNLRISALESAGDGKIVSTPRITTLNGVKAVITQGTKIPYTTISDQGTETQFESAELKLDVIPEVNPDGSVILDIKASNSAVGQIVPTGTGTAISIDEKKAETKVLIKDGETTVIGGIFVEDQRDSNSGVPILKDIPVLGHLFKSTIKTRERRELLIFITPRILES